MMKPLLFATLLLLTIAACYADDVRPDELIQLHEAGLILSLATLNGKALALHEGSHITDTELEQVSGQYIYQVELRDMQSAEREVELDAVTGAVLKNGINQ